MSGCGGFENGFLVLGNEDEWRRGLAHGVRVSAEGLALEGREELVLDVSLDAAELPAGLEGVDFALGTCDLIYVLESSPPAIRVFDPDQDRSETIPCVGALFARPTALAYTPATLYVADPSAADRVVALARIQHQTRWTVGAAHDAAGNELGLPAPLLPVDLAVDAGGVLHVLAPLETAGDPPERVPAGARLAVVKLDRGGRLVEVLQPPSLTLAAELGVDELGASLALAVAADGSVYVLEGAGRRLFKLSPEGELAAGFPVDLAALEGAAAIRPLGLALDAADRVYLGDGRPAPPPDQEDDRFIHQFAPDGSYLGPVTGFRGRIRALALDAADRIYIFDGESTRIVILTRRRNFSSTAAGQPSGVYYSPPLDSTRTGVRWHRLQVEARIPANTQVRVSHLVLEDPAPYAAALAAGDLAALGAFPWSPRLVDPRDALIRDLPGRYLGLRLELEASGADSPRVQQVVAHFPRTSYLRFLPAVYREDLGDDAFFERFLALFETFLGGVEGEIDRVTRHFDAEAVTGDFLAWLASWLALPADEGWPEERLRTLVLRAPELYRQRGTRRGLAALVEILTGEAPMIFEHFQRRCAHDREVRELLDRLYGGDPYSFCVLLRPGQTAGEEELRAVQRLVEAEKPAHTRAGVRELSPFLHLDFHTYLGINTRLTEPVPRLDTGAAIDRDSVLTEAAEAGQVERRARVHLETTLT